MRVVDKEEGTWREGTAGDLLRRSVYFVNFNGPLESSYDSTDVKSTDLDEHDDEVELEFKNEIRKLEELLVLVLVLVVVSSLVSSSSVHPDA